MAETFLPIDTQVLDDYVEIMREQRQLDERMARAEQMKGQVDDSVYRRVADDYAARLQQIVSTREAIGARLLAEFERMDAEHNRLVQAHERARLEKQELEFRRQIGELDAAQAAERIAVPQQTIDECRQGLVRIDSHIARFVQAFGSEEALLGQTTRRLEPGENPARKRAVLHVDGDGPDSADYALGAVARIGRDTDNDVRLESRGMSRQHAVITATPTGFTIKDLDSQNGTVVNGRRVTERELADGDVIVLGDARLRIAIRPRDRR